ncbi:peroxidase family protein [Actinomadura sp. WMMB 499]|uniref:peroxidase family protein n=1 Tax=Actinomadura sp. WMMB 499 TaxID=1219491 RepID=UPI00159E6029|nr:peroxidase family protein [Actinomadura sp. WMMB 499]
MRSSDAAARRRVLAAPLALLLGGGLVTVAGVPAALGAAAGGRQALDGSGNNVRHGDWGRAGTNYARVARARYADGRSEPVTGPNARTVSNRVFNDEFFDANGAGFSVNIFSEQQLSQWAWAWGQFVDHEIGLRGGVLRSDPQGERADIPVDGDDPLETKRAPAAVRFTRSTPAQGTGTANAREQINNVSSYLDGSAVYATTAGRLEWMREGPVDGNLANNGARLLLPGDHLPRRDARGDVAAAPEVELGGELLADPGKAVVTGDPRANNNTAVTAVETLIAREHNRIVDRLPDSLSEEEKFQIARRVVIAKVQYITYNEFLPAHGVDLPQYRGYDPSVDATLSNEFATVGYRIHSMIHSGFPMETERSRYTEEQLEKFREMGFNIDPSDDPAKVKIQFTLAQARDNPMIIPVLGLGPFLQGLGSKAQYHNEEQIERELRDVLCSAPDAEPRCVFDLGALDLERGRDHGMPSYNEMRRAYGLPPARTFTGITGEGTAEFPADPLLTAGDEINDPDAIDFTRITNLFGSGVGPENHFEDTGAVSFERRTTLAARLKALYGSVDRLDAYMGMLAEQHDGPEFGELQRAMWSREFRRLRDGDRFFYGNQMPALRQIERRYGIDFRENLGDLVANNTDVERADLAGNVFFAKGQVPPERCAATYRETGRTGTGSGTFTAALRVTNLSRRPLDAWAVRFRYGDGQEITGVTGGVAAQNGADVPISNPPDGGVIAPGRSRVLEISGKWRDRNTAPSAFTFNTTPCRSR